MVQFITFVKKEFFHVLRDRRTLLILFGMPVAQILIFGFALTNEVNNARITVVDQAQDAASEQLVNRITASRYFEIDKNEINSRQIEEDFRSGRIKMAVIIPANFNQD